jgi:hypothetical protein
MNLVEGCILLFSYLIYYRLGGEILVDFYSITL